MANATAAPKKGRRTNAELRQENAALERELRDKGAVNGLWKTGAVLLLALAVLIGGIWFLVNWNADRTAGESGPKPASLDQRGTGYVSGSWGEVSQHLQDREVRARWDAMDSAMAKYRGFEIPDGAIADHLVREVELADPDRYVWTADRPLTGWLNTNWDRVPVRILSDNFQVGDRFLVMEVNILAKHGVDVTRIPAEAIVALPDGTVCVILTRAVCTNHVWFVRQYAVEPGNGEGSDSGKAAMYTSPLTTPHHPANPYTQDDPSYDVRTGTPGYVPDNVETVESRRGTGPGTTGAPGTGSGGTTPGGSTTIGGTTTNTDGTAPPGDPVDGDSGTPVEPGNTGLDPGAIGND